MNWIYSLVTLIYLKVELSSSASSEVEMTFDPASGDDSYQRKFVINVGSKSEDCYFLPNVRNDQVINFHFVVSIKKGKY